MGRDIGELVMTEPAPSTYDLDALPLAPVFKPSEEEWKDPLRYIYEVIRPKAEATSGIAKIVPPEGWNPPFSIDKKNFKFPTRLQSVHLLQCKNTSIASKAFWDDYNSFLASKNARVRKTPSLCGREIDLYQLFRLVEKRGGYSIVTSNKVWRSIADFLEVRLDSTR